VASEELVTTSGATSGLQLLATVLLDKNGIVFVEDPTYFISSSILAKDLGLKVVPVPMAEDGIDMEELKKAVQREKTGGVCEQDRFWAMVYTIPTYHNPTGKTMSPEKGRMLIELASQEKMLVVCDDVYNLLTYSPLPYSRLRALQQKPENCVISNGTFSKILAPGVRLGWIEAPPGIVSLGLLDVQLDHCKQVYGARMNTALKQLGGLPEGWHVESPGGGYFLWITAPQDLSAFCHQLEKNGVGVLPGPRASSSSPQSSNLFASCRLSIAFFAEEKIALACKTIVQLAKGGEVAPLT